MIQYLRLCLLFALLLVSSAIFAQNIGVGTQTPLEKLHVNGGVRVDTLSGNGLRPVYADANGTLVANNFDLDKCWMRLDSIRALDSIPMIDSILVYVTGYYGPNDGGGGFFYWDPANTDPDNRGTIIESKLSTTGRWMRIWYDEVHLKWFGATGDGVTGDHKAIQRAVDFSIAQNVPLYAEAGTYIIDYGEGGNAAISIKLVDSPDNNFSLIGAGKGLTIFKEDNGKTQSSGRYTKMFYIYLNQQNDVGDIVFRDFTLDKNGRSSTLPGGDNPGDYAWEQAHCIGFSGRANTSPLNLRSVLFQNIHIKDKIGAGINISSMSTQYGSVILENITDEPFSGRFGHRGTLEIGCFSTEIVFDKVNVQYMQIEPVNSGLATALTPRKSFFTNCNIGNLQYTEANSAAPYSEVSVMNCFLKVVTLRNVTFKVENAFIDNIRGFFNSPNGQFVNCQIKVPYDPATNAISPVYPTRYTSQNYDSNLEFVNCDFVIDSDDQTITPTGYLINNNAKISIGSPSMNCYITNCKFDKRAFGSVNNYGNGHFVIKNSRLAGTGIAIQGGTYSSFFAELELYDNDYSQVTGNTFKLLDNAGGYTAIIKEQLDIEDWNMTKQGSAGFYDTNVRIKPRLIADTIPTSGYYLKGTTVEIRMPNAGEYGFYKCVLSGNPGIWKGYGMLEN